MKKFENRITEVDSFVLPSKETLEEFRNRNPLFSGSGKLGSQIDFFDKTSLPETFLYYLKEWCKKDPLTYFIAGENIICTIQGKKIDIATWAKISSKDMNLSLADDSPLTAELKEEMSFEKLSQSTEKLEPVLKKLMEQMSLKNVMLEYKVEYDEAQKALQLKIQFQSQSERKQIGREMLATAIIECEQLLKQSTTTIEIKAEQPKRKKLGVCSIL